MSDARDASQALSQFFLIDVPKGTQPNTGTEGGDSEVCSKLWMRVRTPSGGAVYLEITPVLRNGKASLTARRVERPD